MADIETLVDGFMDEVRSALEERRRPKGGQSVPFFGDFCAAPPSTLLRLEWWAKAMKQALDEERAKSGIVSRTVISEPGAGVQVTVLELSEEAKAGLCVGSARIPTDSGNKK